MKEWLKSLLVVGGLSLYEQRYEKNSTDIENLILEKKKKTGQYWYFKKLPTAAFKC